MLLLPNMLTDSHTSIVHTVFCCMLQVAWVLILYYRNSQYSSDLKTIYYKCILYFLVWIMHLYNRNVLFLDIIEFYILLDFSNFFFNMYTIMVLSETMNLLSSMSSWASLPYIGATGYILRVSFITISVYSISFKLCIVTSQLKSPRILITSSYTFSWKFCLWITCLTLGALYKRFSRFFN